MKIDSLENQRLFEQLNRLISSMYSVFSSEVGLIRLCLFRWIR